MVDCIMYIALDLVDGYYQLLMRASGIPPTAVSIPRGMRWEWLVITQQLSNAPATVNRLITQLVLLLTHFVKRSRPIDLVCQCAFQQFRPHRGYAQTCFDGTVVHSRAERD